LCRSPTSLHWSSEPSSILRRVARR
jgi:hypothetical protein